MDNRHQQYKQVVWIDIILGDVGEEGLKSWNIPNNEPTTDVGAFLREHPAAKIVIVIDTPVVLIICVTKS